MDNLADVDPKTDPVVLIPIAAMMMVIAVVMIIATPVIIPVLVAIIRPCLAGPARQ